MRASQVWTVAAVMAVACALPKVELDPTLTPAGGGTGGGSGGGSGGKASPGKGGTGPLAGDAGAGMSEDRELQCGDYCMTFLQNCGDFPTNTYDDLTDCITTCFTSDWPLGTDAGQPNSILCRDTHAHLAAQSQDPHCFHSAEVPTHTTCALPAK